PIIFVVSYFMPHAFAFRSRARRMWRALWPALVVGLGAVTCDNPMAPKPAYLAVAPRIDLAGIREYAGMSIDQAQLIVTRVAPPNDTLANQLFPFSPDSASLDVSLSVSVIGTEQL